MIMNILILPNIITIIILIYSTNDTHDHTNITANETTHSQEFTPKVDLITMQMNHISMIITTTTTTTTNTNTNTDTDTDTDTNTNTTNTNTNNNDQVFMAKVDLIPMQLSHIIILLLLIIILMIIMILIK